MGHPGGLSGPGHLGAQHAHRRGRDLRALRWLSFDDYSGQEDERGLYGNISTRVGPLCEDAADTTSDCIPCFIEEGCTLNIDVDLCYVGNDEEIGRGVSIAKSDGEIFHNECAEGGDVEPCEVLDDWIQAEPESLTSDLCDE